MLDELIEDWLADYKPPFEGVRLIGHRWSARSYEIKDLLARNHVPFQWLDVETSEDARELLAGSGRDEESPPRPPGRTRRAGLPHRAPQGTEPHDEAAVTPTAG